MSALRVSLKSTRGPNLVEYYSARTGILMQSGIANMFALMEKYDVLLSSVAKSNADRTHGKIHAINKRGTAQRRARSQI